jgi:hypothetical protein
MSFDKFGNKARARAARERKAKATKNVIGASEKNKLSAIFAEITEYEKEAKKQLIKTARAYYNAGNILAGIVKQWGNKEKSLSAKAVAEAAGFPERRIVIALKIFKHFENNPDALKTLSLRDALKLIAPPPPAGEEGYNRIDLGGDPGQLNLDFGELFNLPATGNLSLQNYRTVGDMLDEIIVVWRTKDNLLTSRRYVKFFDDIPQNPTLRSAFKTMSQKTQAAIEDYLAALEQEENQ